MFKMLTPRTLQMYYYFFNLLLFYVFQLLTIALICLLSGVHVILKMQGSDKQGYQVN